MDFVHDQLATGTRIRILTVVDTFSRFVPAIVPRLSFRAPDVIEVLERVGREIGLPKTIRVDNGEPSSSPVISTSGHISETSRSTSPGPANRPSEARSATGPRTVASAFIESLNGKFRAECLNAHWFMNLDDAARKCEAWRRDYNEVRPHSAIGNKSPIELTNRSAAHGPP